MRDRLENIAVILLGTSLMLLGLGAGTAVADPDVVGMKYGEARGEIYKANLVPVVATVVGDRVTRNDCFVVSTSKLTPRDSSGKSATNQIAVNLSCYASPANRMSPGYSAGNYAPDAVAVREKKAAEDLKWRKSTEGQKWCTEQLTAHPDWTIEGCAPIVAAPAT